MGCVWLGRDDPLPLDDIVVERFAIAAGLLLEAAPRRGDAGLVEVVLSGTLGNSNGAGLFVCCMSNLTTGCMFWPLKAIRVRTVSIHGSS